MPDNNKVKKNISENDNANIQPSADTTAESGLFAADSDNNDTIDLNYSNLRQMLIDSEIFGKPVSKRRGRWY